MILLSIARLLDFGEFCFDRLAIGPLGRGNFERGLEVAGGAFQVSLPRSGDPSRCPRLRVAGLVADRGAVIVDRLVQMVELEAGQTAIAERLREGRLMYESSIEVQDGSFHVAGPEARNPSVVQGADILGIVTEGAAVVGDRCLEIAIFKASIGPHQHRVSIESLAGDEDERKESRSENSRGRVHSARRAKGF
jgi:hypothetical protein